MNIELGYMTGFRGIEAFSTEELNTETEKVFLRVRVTTITFRLSFITDICPFPAFLGGENVTFLHKHILSQSVMLSVHLDLFQWSMQLFIGYSIHLV